MGVWGAIANKMGASQETFIWVKITQASFQIIKWYVPKKKASYLIYLKAYVVKLGKKNTLLYGGLGATAPRSK